MRLVTLPTHPHRTRKKRRVVRWRFVAASTCLVLAAANYARPLPPPALRLSLPTPPAPVAPAVAWPAYGQASLTAAGLSTVLTHGAQTPLSTASIAKVITALCVLEKYPLAPGQTGPVLTLSEADVALYRLQLGLDGSNLPVYAGERLTQYQALQALMIPSANNVADSLAQWAFGSLDAYATYANEYVQRHGLVHTTIGSDASGLDPSTKSTAEDLARVGLIAAGEPVLMEIAAQPWATFPYGGRQNNYNTKLGAAGINGLKTGNNTENPGAFLYTAPIRVGSREVLITGAVMGAANLAQALDSSEALVASAGQAFEQVTYAAERQPIGTLVAPWGSRVPVRTEKPLILTRWKGTALQVHSTSTPYNGPGKVGTVDVRADTLRASTSVVTDHPLPGPSVWWRLTRHEWL